MNKLNLSNLELKCSACDQTYKVKPEILANKRSVQCKYCENDLYMEIYIEEYRFPFIEKNPFIDLETSIHTRIN